ncbi:MAG: TonB-dependent receptor, partial [Chloroflexi bacterium]
ENGWVYWSNWDGLADATSSIQMQRGLSAVNLATPSIGGTMNVITDPSAVGAGVRYKQEFGNDGFMKSTVSAATGTINGKYSFMGTLVRKKGDGLIKGTWTDAWAYYFGAAYQANPTNRFELYVMGAPQRHGQNLYKQNIGAYSHEYAKSLDDYDPAALEVFKEAEDGRLYNENVNDINGTYQSAGLQWWNGGLHPRYSDQFINERENYYHKPLANLNWYSQLSDNMNLFTTVYYSGGVGGGTGTYGSMGWDYSGPSRVVDWDATIERNKANADGSRGILRNSVNTQWTVGAISKLNYKPTKAVDVNIGLDWRTAEINHFREVRDLLGGAYYRNTASDFWTEEEQKRGLGDKIAYYNTNTVDWLGFYAQSEYSMGRLTAYGMGGYSMISHSYVDHFKDDGTGNELTIESGNIPGFQVKGGAQYSVLENLDVYGNVGYVSKVPIFDNVIDDVNGVKADNPENEKFTSFELGTNWFAEKWTIKLSYYYTKWVDRAISRGVTLENGDYAIIFLTGMNQLHTGLEFEAAYQPASWVRLGLAGAVASLTYLADGTRHHK